MNNKITNLQYLSLTEATSDVSLKNVNILGYIDKNYGDCLPENKPNRHMFIDGDSDL